MLLMLLGHVRNLAVVRAVAHHLHSGSRAYLERTPLPLLLPLVLLLVLVLVLVLLLLLLLLLVLVLPMTMMVIMTRLTLF